MRKSELRKMIREEIQRLTEASAGEEAKKRGLKSIGFGRYVDPSDPSKVVAKSVKGRLVAVKPGEEKKSKEPKPQPVPGSRAAKALKIQQALKDVTRKAEEYEGEYIGGDAKTGFMWLFPDKETAEMFVGAETPSGEPKKAPEMRPVKHKGAVKYSVRIKGKNMQPTVDPTTEAQTSDA